MGGEGIGKTGHASLTKTSMQRTDLQDHERGKKNFTLKKKERARRGGRFMKTEEGGKGK